LSQAQGLAGDAPRRLGHRSGGRFGLHGTWLDAFNHPRDSTEQLAVYTVTRGQFRKFVEAAGYRTEAETDDKGGWGWDFGKNDWRQDPKYTWRDPGFEQTDEHPVVDVSWNDAKAFCAWLSKKDGRTYRLPTEAEWEYACRAGTTTRYFFGDDDEDLARYANGADASLHRITRKFYGIKADDGYAFTSPVGRFKANPWCLYDMHGNVCQWCEDYYGPYKGLSNRDPIRMEKYNEDRRIMRGGAWLTGASSCRAANRARDRPGFFGIWLGFRLYLRLN
jgi:formylglycine-generating enzyme required for sulfatase activity